MGDTGVRIVATFTKIEKARVLLELREEATLKQIKSSYRRLALKYHPDICSTIECQETMKKINKAFGVVSKYCSDYCYSFREEDISRTYPVDEYFRKWKNDWRV